MHLTRAFRPLSRDFGRLLRCSSGLALTEFAYAAPLFAMLGLGGLELSNYALSTLRISQVASNLADTLSRSGEVDGLGMKHIRDIDINDAFAAIAVQAGNLNLVQNGRIILSSLEQNSAGGQWIRWQRCFGNRTAYTSSYGNAGDGRTGATTISGMGPAGAQVTAPDSASAVMFVEVKYQYQPLVNLRYAYSAPPIIQARAAFLVRDRRDLSPGQDPVPAGTPPANC